MIYEIILTEKCNWNCYYCGIPEIQDPQEIQELDEKQIRILTSLRKVSTSKDLFILEGGEIGLVPETVIERVLCVLEGRKIIIDTNGLFIEKGYFEKFYNKIFQVYYHLVEDPCQDQQVKICKDPKILNGIVGEPDCLYNFIQSHPEVFFHYIGVETKNKDFSYSEHKDTFVKIANLKNVNKIYAIHMLNFSTYSQERIEQARNFCSSRKNNVLNLARKQFVKCASKCPTVSVDSVCDKCSTCYRVCLYSKLK